MKILCLHGYRQNVRLFSKSADSLVKKLKKIAQVEFINSPFLIKEGEIGYEEGIDRRKWWSLQKKDDLFEPISYDLAEESISYVAKYYNENKFDGILGFSQGSVVVQCLLLREMINPRFTILIGTFPITDPAWLSFEFRRELPLLFCIGERDELVPRSKTEELLRKLRIPFEVCLYAGGHYVPSNAEAVRIICDFVMRVGNS